MTGEAEYRSFRPAPLPPNKRTNIHQFSMTLLHNGVEKFMGTNRIPAVCTHFFWEDILFFCITPGQGYAKGGIYTSYILIFLIQYKKQPAVMSEAAIGIF